MIGIIDYGMGNIRSVVNGFKRIGAEAVLIDAASQVEKCDGLVLPGVGAFPHAMTALTTSGLSQNIISFARAGKPVLGICLGMQLLMDSSEEFGYCQGLGLIPGDVVEIPRVENYRVPHMGWNSLRISNPDSILFEGASDESSYYFVHSFMVRSKPEYIVATTEHGSEIAAALQHGNILATQFHPEKSQSGGAHLLTNFMKLVKKQEAFES